MAKLLLVFSLASRISASQDLREMLYAVTLNGEDVSEGTVVLQAGEGRFLLEEADLRQWRIRLPRTGAVTFQNRTFYPLDPRDGITIAVDSAAQALRIQVPANLLVRSVLQGDEPAAPTPVHGTGAFWNYDLSLEKGRGASSRLGGIFEGGFFGRFGVLTSSVIAAGTGVNRSVTRLDTLWVLDDARKRRSFRIGDSFTRGGATGSPVRFGGVQWATNFSTDPGFITFPTPSLAGLAQKASVVDVLVNNVKVLSKEAPPGPFDIRALPVTTGKGEVSLVVTDLLGREQSVVVPYYASPSLLKKGLSDFSYEAGARREFRERGDSGYDRLLFSGTHRYGVTDQFTGEAHLEVEKSLTMAGLAGAWVHRALGVFSAGAAGSRGSGGWGQQAFLGYNRVSRAVSFGLTTRMTSRRFAQIGLDGRLPYRHQHFANFGMGLGRLGSVGLTLTYQRQYEGRTTSILTGSYNKGLRKGYLTVSGYRSFDADASQGLTATYTIPLGRRASLRTSGNVGGSGSDTDLEMQKSVSPVESGYGYRVGAENVGGVERLYANVTAQGDSGRATLDVARLDGSAFYRGSVSGSLGTLDGALFSSRWLSQSFGIARVAEYENVRVYSANQEVGKTNRRGYVIIPNLLPYYSNPLTLEAGDLPADCGVESTAATAVPFSRSGVTVRFPIKPVRGATVTAVSPDGTFLPAGTVLRRDDVGGEWYVALKGQAYLTELPVGAVTLHAEMDAESCTLTLIVPKDLSSVPDLGSVTCKPKS